MKRKCALVMWLVACGGGESRGPTDGATGDSRLGSDMQMADGGSRCGNGTLDEGEDCDDGNPTDSDGCNADCRVSGAQRWELAVEFESRPESAWLQTGVPMRDQTFCALGRVNAFDFSESGSLLVCVDEEGNVTRRQEIAELANPFRSAVELGSGEVIVLAVRGRDESGLIRFQPEDVQSSQAPEGMVLTQIQVRGDALLASAQQGADVDSSTGWLGVLDRNGNVVETLHTDEQRVLFSRLALNPLGGFYSYSVSRDFRRGFLSAFSESGEVRWETEGDRRIPITILATENDVRFFSRNPVVGRSSSSLGSYDLSGELQEGQGIPGADGRNAVIAPNGDTIALTYRESDDEAEVSTVHRFAPDGTERWSRELEHEASRYVQAQHVNVMPSGQVMVIGARWSWNTRDERWRSPQPLFMALEP